MCGIIGILGSTPVAPRLVEALKRLEYRGYDSAGIALQNGTLNVYKKKGKVADLVAYTDPETVQKLAAATLFETYGSFEWYLEFKRGKVIAATSSNTKRLNEILDSDAGARYIGEFALGFNPHILEPMREAMDTTWSTAASTTPLATLELRYDELREPVAPLVGDEPAVGDVLGQPEVDLVLAHALSERRGPLLAISSSGF